MKQGAGLGVLSELTLDKELARRELALVEVEGLALERPFYLIRHKSHSLTPLAQAFIDFCGKFLKLKTVADKSV